MSPRNGRSSRNAPAFPRPPGDGPALLAYSARAIIRATWRGHLLPLLHGIIAMGYYLWAQRYMGRAGIGIASTVVEFMTICNYVTDLQHHSTLVETGGRRGSSGALNQLASYLDESGQRQPIAQDWGLKYNVPILTQALVTGERVHLSHGVDDYVTYPRLLLSEKAPREPGMPHALLAEPRERDGAPIYQIYAAR